MSGTQSGQTARLKSLERPIEPASAAAYTVTLVFAGAETQTVNLADRDNREGWNFAVQAVHVNSLNNANKVTLSVAEQGVDWQDEVAASATAMRYPPAIVSFKMDVTSAGAGTTKVTLYNVPQFPTSYP